MFFSLYLHFFSLWFFLHLKFFNIITSYCLQRIFFLSLSIVYLHLIIVMTSQWNNKVINYTNWSIKKMLIFLSDFLFMLSLNFMLKNMLQFKVSECTVLKNNEIVEKDMFDWIFFFGLVFFLTYTYYNY